MNKIRCLIILLVIYLLAFAIGALCAFRIPDTIMAWFVFDIAATVVTFAFSVLLKNSSVYDPYWSLTPMIMTIALFVMQRAFSVWQLLFLVVFNVWSVRLTANWMTVFTDFTYEDWRYRKFRAENHGILWFIINFFGIHLVPTLVVFAGMLPIFILARETMNAWSLIGMALILCGVALEFFADRQMHAHLAADETHSVCTAGLWKYSRHPNYLGEITVWLGVFVTMIVIRPDMLYMGAGFLSVVLLFNVVSIPMMEKRQLARRSDYAAYRKHTARLLLLPNRK